MAQPPTREAHSQYPLFLGGNGVDSSSPAMRAITLSNSSICPCRHCISNRSCVKARAMRRTACCQDPPHTRRTSHTMSKITIIVPTKPRPNIAPPSGHRAQGYPCRHDRPDSTCCLIKTSQHGSSKSMQAPGCDLRHRTDHFDGHDRSHRQRSCLQGGRPGFTAWLGVVPSEHSKETPRRSPTLSISLSERQRAIHLN